MSKEYQKLQGDYQAALAKSKAGDPAARTEKAKIAGELRQAEREAARSGTVLNPVIRGGKLIVQETPAPTRRSLQEEYTRSYDDNVQVKIDRKEAEPFVGTLRQFHRKRLGV